MYFPVSKWLKVMFPEVMFCPSELSSASADSLSRCDLEVCVLGGGGGGRSRTRNTAGIAFGHQILV